MALVASGLSVVVPQLTAPAAQAVQSPTSCNSTVALQDGGFEQPVIPPNSFKILNEADVPGWNTDAPDKQMELWSDGYDGARSDTGNQFAELNANVSSTLYQDIATTPGQVLGWSLAHRGRLGDDTMAVFIGSPTGTLEQSGPALTDSRFVWGHYTGTYTVPAGQTTTRFAFRAISSAGGDTSYGNFLDSINFGTGPCVLTDKSVQNLSGDSPARVGDVLRYTVRASNQGGTPALLSELTDRLDPGLDYVPGSLRIVQGQGAGALTDGAGDDRGEYTAADRTVHFRLGAGGSATAGGEVQAGTTPTVTFDARVNRTAAAGAVSNEAVVAYSNQFNSVRSTSTSQTVTTAVDRAADLAIAKRIDTSPVVAGRPVSWTLTASNSGPHTGTGVRVTDALPAGVTGVTAAGPGATCTTTGGAVDCTLPDLAVGASSTITVSGTVAPSTAAGSGLTNTATIGGT
ncbi:MAG: DUF11 domain-containing protein, partial [Williamsia herbipolensis]|nr:DUF11 domain-containing protein [Williamsia herbipolensis]